MLRLYNTVTFGNELKWEQMRPETRRTADEAVRWLKARDIALRGHNLLWGSYMFIPPPFNALRGDALLKACREHVTEYATWMKGNVYVWDVVNEAVTNTELWDEIGWDKFAECYRWAHAADPGALLCYNEYNIVQENSEHRAKAAQRVRDLLKRKVPLDVLGIQGHMTTPLTPVDRVLEILDEWAALGKDLEITEFDLCLKDDKAHGEYVRDFMTAVFSHPKVKAFIIWGFWEGYHWHGPGRGDVPSRLEQAPRPRGVGRPRAPAVVDPLGGKNRPERHDDAPGILRQAPAHRRSARQARPNRYRTLARQNGRGNAHPEVAGGPVGHRVGSGRWRGSDAPRRGPKTEAS